MSKLLTTDAELRQLLKSAKTIAVVGISENEIRASFGVAKYLAEAGYEIFPVNPQLSSWQGITAYPTVNAIGHPVDIVDVFRGSEYLLSVVEDALTASAGAVWAQLGVSDDAAIERAIAAGIPIVVDHCAKMEHRRLIAGQGDHK
ncbi:MAG: CoA-binding protein [Chloroflexi bacterium]|nr:CoA-binding protein [Chloroflexota bacterium]